MIKIRELEILKPDQIKDIFVNIEDIVKVSEELTEQLRFRIVGWEESYGLSDIFEKSVNTILTFNNQIPYRFNILNMISQHTFTFLSFFFIYKNAFYKNNFFAQPKKYILLNNKHNNNYYYYFKNTKKYILLLKTLLHTPFFK